MNTNNTQFMVSYDELFHIFEYLDLSDIINVQTRIKTI